MKPLVWVYWRLVQGILISQLGLWGQQSHLCPGLRIEDDMYCGHGIIDDPDMFPMMHKIQIKAVKGKVECILPSGKIHLADGDNGSQ